MTARTYAFVEAVREDSPTKHYHGFPPDLTGGEDQRTLLPAAEIVAIAPERGGVLLIRYTATGAFAGDTWHASEEEARTQAHAEYRLGQWREVSDDAGDVLEYILNRRA